MKKITLALVAVFFLIVAFPGCGKKGALSSDQFANLPGQAQMLASVNLQKLLAIPEIDALIQKEASKEDKGMLRRFYTRFKDRSSRFSFAIYPAAAQGGEIMIASLNLSYDRQDIIELLREKDTEYTARKEQGIELIEIADSKDNSRDVLLLLDKQILVMDLKHLAFYMKSRASKEKVLDSPALKDGLAKISPDKLFFLVGGNIDQLAKQTQALPGPKPQAALAEIDYRGDAFVGMVKVVTKDESEAKNSVNMVNGLKSLFAMSMSEKNPDAAAVLNKINISAEGKELKIDFNVTIEELQKLSKLK